MRPKDLISVENISYPTQPRGMIQNLSFTLKRGECLALMGANGTGKTTTLRLLAGLLRPSTGQVLINGFNIHKDPLLAKLHLGFLPDTLPLYHELTVKEYLNFICKLHHIPKQNQSEAIEKTLEQLALKGYKDHIIGTLSRGLKQRVAIAQAIIHHPSILLLDEPTQGLDPTQIEIFCLFLSEYKKEAAIILSSHYLNEVEYLCDKILQFNMQGMILNDLNHCPA